MKKLIAIPALLAVLTAGTLGLTMLPASAAPDFPTACTAGRTNLNWLGNYYGVRLYRNPLNGDYYALTCDKYRHGIVHQYDSVHKVWVRNAAFNDVWDFGFMPVVDGIANVVQVKGNGQVLVKRGDKWIVNFTTNNFASLYQVWYPTGTSITVQYYDYSHVLHSVTSTVKS